MAQSGCPGRRGRYDQRAGDGAGIGDFTASGQRLPALRLRSLGGALATARGCRQGYLMRNDMNGWTKHPRRVERVNIIRQWRFQPTPAAVRVVQRKAPI